jgi:hypothetical protein
LNQSDFKKWEKREKISQRVLLENDKKIWPQPNREKCGPNDEGLQKFRLNLIQLKLFIFTKLTWNKMRNPQKNFYMEEEKYMESYAATF